MVLRSTPAPWVLRSINEMWRMDHGVYSKETAAPCSWFVGGSTLNTALVIRVALSFTLRGDLRKDAGHEGRPHPTLGEDGNFELGSQDGEGGWDRVQSQSRWSRNCPE